MDAETIGTTIQYMIGFAAGCVSGYGFSMRQAREKMQMHNEILTMHKEQIEKLESRLKQFEEIFYPNFCERRKGNGKCRPSQDRRNQD